MRWAFLLLVLITAQRLMASYVPLGWVHPQLLLPVCVYLGIVQFSVRGALSAFGCGVLMDGVTGAVIGPWAGGSIVAFMVAGVVARSSVFPSRGAFAGVLCGASLAAFGVFHGMQLAITQLFPSIGSLFEEAFMTTVAGVVTLSFIRWWLEPRRVHNRGNAGHGARRYV
jgi:hypothetical protein